MDVRVSWNPDEKEEATKIVEKIAKVLYGVDEVEATPPRGITIIQHEHGGGYSIYP